MMSQLLTIRDDLQRRLVAALGARTPEQIASEIGLTGSTIRTFLYGGPVLFRNADKIGDWIEAEEELGHVRLPPRE